MQPQRSSSLRMPEYFWSFEVEKTSVFSKIANGLRSVGQALTGRKQVVNDEEDIPLRQGADSDAPPETRWCPEEKAGWLSRFLFLYVDSLIRKGASKHLDQDDLWDVAYRDEAEAVYGHYEHILKGTVDPIKAPKGVVWRAMWRAHGSVMLWTAALKVVHDIVMFMPPVILEQLLHHMANGGSRLGSAGWSSLLLLTAVVENLMINVYFHALYLLSLHMKVNMIQMLYDKSLRITGGVKSEMGVGTIVNLQSNDASKLWNLPLYMHMIWNGPFQIMIVMGLLVRLMGWAPAMAGLGITVALIPASTFLGKALASTRRTMVKQTDERVKLSSEVITGIKAIKLYAWEDPYVDRINKLREEELKMVKRTGLISALNSGLYMSGPVLVALAAFGVYSLLSHRITAAVAFPALALFNLLRFPIVMLPAQIMNLINAHVGITRIQNFMEKDEMATVDATNASEREKNSSSQKGTTNGFHANSPDHGPDMAISVHQASFGWELDNSSVLKDLTFTATKGELVIVVGEVGCGKSSLLHALLSEMHRKTGTLQLSGSVAYTAQDPWIQNKTLRDNILMDSSFDEAKYTTVLDACSLEQDLQSLPAGDQSEIGEKGINLSGGQKHRVALARACYADAAIYLLDDPLSAVDAHVGRELFVNCICGLLGDKTRILVTHQLQYLPAADRVVVLSEGNIAQEGTYKELIDRGVDFSKVIKCEGGETASTDPDQDLAAIMSDVQAKRASLALERVRLSVDVEVKGGATSASRFSHDKNVLSKPVDEEGHDSDDKNAPLVPSTSSSKQASQEGGNTGMGADTGKTGVSDDKVAMKGEEDSSETTSLLPSKSFSTNDATRARLKKSMSVKELDGKIVKVEERAKGQVEKSVYKTYISAWSPCWYWVPIIVLVMALAERGLQVGQNFVLALWSNHTAANDDPHTKYYLTLYFSFGFVSIFCQYLRAFMTVIGANVASHQLHTRLLTKVVRLPMSFFDSQPTGRLLNRFTKDTEAIDVQVANSVSGALTTVVSSLFSMVVVAITAPVTMLFIVPLCYLYYRIQVVYIASGRELKRLDSLAFSPIFSHFSESLQGLTTIRAFTRQREFIAKNRFNLNYSNRAYWPIQVVNRWLSVRLELMGALIVFLAALFVSTIMPTNPGLAGLAITSALNLTGIMNWAVRQVTELEVNMNSVERVMEYDRAEEEAPAVIEACRPPIGWPNKGVISIEKLCARYRPELDLVLTDLSFTAKSYEKIGVCGRTGCGKSTLFLALYRILEPCGGRVVIDGVDTSTIGLKDLRSHLSLVPQDPVIFSGTIRSNLDPFDETSSDAAIWESLSRAGVQAFVKELPKGLDSDIKEGGANMSVGQRQMLCMARALLRNTKILVLDEATSNVDNATDSLIQTTIRSAFQECTVLTIAHRLHTIVDSDRILVLDAGRLKEFDTPSELLRRPDSSFRKLVEETASTGGATGNTVARALAAAIVK